MSNQRIRFEWHPYSAQAADRLRSQLGLSRVGAAILVRRGYDTVASAARFLEAADSHDPSLFEGMGAICETILAHMRRGSRIVVFGDYDVDGVCATAVLVRALRALGANCDWRLPNRLSDGYGLSEQAIKELSGRGTDLLITVDCGIAASAEIALASTLGMEVIVTDHHQPAGELPPCQVLHPVVCGYPFSELCATAVASKLCEALYLSAGANPADCEDDLDLVCVATVCDAVALCGENRRLVKTGLTKLAHTRKPGLRALMATARLDRFALTAHAVAFRLGPRLNAAGRLASADAAFELVMTEDPDRARAIADELDFLNRERQNVESRVLFAAEAARSEQSDAWAYVVCGEGWHPGVLGIVASRMVERHTRPCVVIGTDSGLGRGSARSIPSYHLAEALAECAQNLRRFGGHSQAAGLEIDTERVADFRVALQAHARRSLTEADLVPRHTVDALVGADALGLELAEELERLEPFGEQNPRPRLLIPACTVSEVAAMGEEGSHARFNLANGGSRARCVAFRRTASSLTQAQGRLQDACVRLELNEFNGVVEPRLVLEALSATPHADCEVVATEHSFFQSLERELYCDLEHWIPRLEGPRRSVYDRRGCGFAGVAADLVSSGDRVCVVCADSRRRLRGVSSVLGAVTERAASHPTSSDPALAIAAWDELFRDPKLADRFEHLVALDPPPSPAGEGLLESAPAPGSGGFCHLLWGQAEIDFALAFFTATLELRPALAEFFRELRSSHALEGTQLENALVGSGAHPRGGIESGRIIRVLSELGLCRYTAHGDGGPRCELVSTMQTSLERSAAYRAFQRRLEDARSYLKVCARAA